MYDLPLDEVLLTLDKAAQAPAGPGMMQYILLFGAIGAVMYVFIYLPQRREQKAKEALMSSLAKDDEVVVGGGIHGKVVSVEDTIVVVDIGDRTKVRVEKSAIERKGAVADAKSDKK